MSKCQHRKAVVVGDNGQLRPQDRRMPFLAAWCPDCGAFREASATKDPETWKRPGRKFGGAKLALDPSEEDAQ